MKWPVSVFASCRDGNGERLSTHTGFFNSLAVVREMEQNILLDSNIDWGQD